MRYTVGVARPVWRRTPLRTRAVSHDWRRNEPHEAHPARKKCGTGCGKNSIGNKKSCSDSGLRRAITLHCGREIQQLGHDVRLIAPIFVTTFAKRGKSDSRGAAAIVEATERPTMRFASVRTQQA